ncbi:hypothetical protein ACRBEV_05145 [Methylobacterium phyllosphaerae]
MRMLQLFIAGFMLATAMFVTTMLTSPPTSEAAVKDGGAAASTPLVLVGP